MDEPFSGLDPVNALLLEDTLLQLKREGRTILFSTHRMDQVEKLCDEIALVNGGRVVLEGAMREVKSRYPRERLLLALEGAAPAAMAGVLAQPSIAASREFADHFELQLAAGANAQMLLREVLATGAAISRWELQEPSLEEIFVRTVGGRVDA
jgi:ABC-2 type transport system ATP-binding protein